MNIRLSLLAAALLLPSALIAQNGNTVNETIDSSFVIANSKYVKPTPYGCEIVMANYDTRGKKTVDLLKNMPLLKVDNNSLSMTGKNEVILYINERPIKMSGKALTDYLNSIPAELIKSVTIMTNPPAKFDAGGDMGIIRINTKANLIYGLRGSLSGDYGRNSYSSYMGSMYLGRNGKKFYWDGSITGDDIAYRNKTEYDNFYPDMTLSTYNPKKWKTDDYEASLNAGYRFNDKSTLSFDASYPLYSKDRISDIENRTQFKNADMRVDSTLTSEGIACKRSKAINLGAYFNHKFDDGNTLSISSDFSRFLNETQKNFSSSIEKTAEPSELKEYYTTTGHLSYNILTSKADYVTTMAGLTVNAGMKGSFVWTSSDDSYSGVSSFRDYFVYKEDVGALYVSAEKKMEKMSFNAGLRSELTCTSGSSESLSILTKKNYLNLFPTANLTYSFAKASTIGLHYSRRINRPPFRYLDPFKWYLTKYSYSTGDPMLKPSYINNISLDYYYGDSFQVNFYFKKENDKVGSLVILDSDDALYQVEKANNYLDATNVGTSIYKYLNPCKWYEASIKGEVAYSRYTSDRKEFEKISGFGGMISANNDFTISDAFQLNLSLSECLPGLYNFRRYKNSFQADLDATYTFEKYGLTLNLSVSDIFKKSSPEYSYFSAGVKQVYRNYYDTRSIMVGLKWIFGDWKSRIVHKEASNLEERKRVG